MFSRDYNKIAPIQTLFGYNVIHVRLGTTLDVYMWIAIKM